MASWHRFFLDFGRFWEASWEGNQSQDRPKKASKNDAKKKSSEIAKKVAIRIPNPAIHPGSWVLGRCPLRVWRTPPLPAAEPPPPSPATPFHTFPLQSLPFLFLSLPFPSLPLSSFVLACLGLSWLDFPSQLGSNLAPQTHPKPDKIESRRPSLFRIHFLIDRSSIFTSNFDPLLRQNHCFSLGKNEFFSKNRFPKLASIFAGF